MFQLQQKKGDQYEDGNGDNFFWTTNRKEMFHKSIYWLKIKKALKKTVLTKGQFNINDDSEIKLSYTANRSDEFFISKGLMDADYDDSNIYTVDIQLEI